MGRFVYFFFATLPFDLCCVISSPNSRYHGDCDCDTVMCIRPSDTGMILYRNGRLCNGIFW